MKALAKVLRIQHFHISYTDFQLMTFQARKKIFEQTCRVFTGEKVTNRSAAVLQCRSAKVKIKTQFSSPMVSSPTGHRVDSHFPFIEPAFISVTKFRLKIDKLINQTFCRSNVWGIFGGMAEKNEFVVARCAAFFRPLKIGL